MNKCTSLYGDGVLHITKINNDLFQIEPLTHCKQMTRGEFLSWVNDLKNLAKKGSRSTAPVAPDTQNP